MIQKKADKSLKKSSATWPLVWTHPPYSHKCAEHHSWTMKSWKKWFTFIWPHTLKIIPIFLSWLSIPSRKIANIPQQKLEVSLWEIFARSDLLIMWTAYFQLWESFFWILTRMSKRQPLQASWKCFTMSQIPFWVKLFHNLGDASILDSLSFAMK